MYYGVDSLVDIEGMVRLEQHCNIPPCPHHYLLHPPGVLGNKTAHIIHLSVSFKQRTEYWIKAKPNVLVPQ